MVFTNVLQVGGPIHSCKQCGCPLIFHYENVLMICYVEQAPKCTYLYTYGLMAIIFSIL